jgi:hypothetical protein
MTKLKINLDDLPALLDRLVLRAFLDRRSPYNTKPKPKRRGPQPSRSLTPAERAARDA